jgi:hypothetical protein
MRWIVLFVALTACMNKRLNRLSGAEFDHYYALKVYMDKSAKKTFLKLKTEEERNTWLKSEGLWERFYKYPEHIRTLIVEGDVQIGWTKDMLHMAWGRPFDRNKQLDRDAVRSWMLLYRFEKHDDEDGRYDLVWEPNSPTEYKAIGRFRKEVILDDDVIAEIRIRDGW